MAKPDWRKANQAIYQQCLRQELDMGWPHGVASERARQRANRSSERAINAYQETYKMVASSHPGWTDSQIHEEASKLERLKSDYNQTARSEGWSERIKHIRWTVAGDEVLKV